MNLPILFIFIFIFNLNVFSYDLFSYKNNNFEIKGYDKNLSVISKTVFDEDYFSNLNRLRFTFTLKPFLNENLSTKLIYDNEITSGNVLKTTQFKMLKNNKSDTYFDLEKNISDSFDIYWKHSINSFYFTYDKNNFTVNAGRQKISLGVTKIWSPMDILDQRNVLSLERDEKQGVDAVNIDYYINSISKLNFIFAPKKEYKDYIIKIKTNVKMYDLSFMSGIVNEDIITGLDFSGYIKDSGFRGEIIQVGYKQKDNYIQYVFSWDYTFSNTYFILIEYLYNDLNVGLSHPYIRYSNKLITQNNNFLGLDMSYDLTPLTKIENFFIYDIDGKSFFVNPYIEYNMYQNLYLNIGLQLFSGNENSEFGNIKDVYYGQLKLYF